MQITLSDIGKRYDAHWIFRGVAQSFSSNGVYPIIGRNGSGKSTFLQIVSGYVTPNEGERSYSLDNEVLNVDDVYSHISIAAPYLDLFEEFTVEESIHLHQKLKSFDSGIDVPYILKSIDLENHSSKLLRVLSSGMKQRLKLALALYSKSQLLLLDEPCSNLDAHWMNWYNETLEKVKTDRVVIISSNSHEQELKQATQNPIDLSADRYR